MCHQETSGYSLCDAANYCGVSNDCAAQKKDEYVKQKVKCDRLLTGKVAI